MYTFFPLSTFFTGESFHTFLHDLEIPPPKYTFHVAKKCMDTPLKKVLVRGSFSVVLMEPKDIDTRTRTHHDFGFGFWIFDFAILDFLILGD